MDPSNFLRTVKGALQWIKEMHSPEFARASDEAISRSRASGNEHAVTQTRKGLTLPIAEGSRYEVIPSYSTKKRNFSYLDPEDVSVLMHTHPYDLDFPITVAPSRGDLELPSARKSTQLIVSPDKDTFVQYQMPGGFPFDEVDPLYYSLMKRINGSMDGIEPIKPDIHLSILRRLAEDRKAKLIQNLGDETPYSDELYRQLFQR